MSRGFTSSAGADIFIDNYSEKEKRLTRIDGKYFETLVLSEMFGWLRCVGIRA